MTQHAFIFDMDGTLIDNTGFHTRIWLEVLASRGVQMDVDAFNRRTAGKTNPQILREMLGNHLTQAEIDALAEEKESIYRERFRPHIKPVGGLVEFLDAARRSRIPLALATSAGRTNVNYILDNLGLQDYFPVVVDQEQIENSKPHPEIFLKAASRLGVEPRYCTVFEDSLAGVEAARRAGMRAVAITTTLHREDFQAREEVLQIIRDYRELDPSTLVGLPAGRPPV